MAEALRVGNAPFKRLAFDHGVSGAVNEISGCPDRVMDAFDKFDLEVFGDTIEIPQLMSDIDCIQNSHYDHENALVIDLAVRFRAQVLGRASSSSLWIAAQTRCWHNRRCNQTAQ